MRHFDETKAFGAATVGAVALGIGYLAGLTDWALIFMPVAVMAAYWLIIDRDPR
jgi:hypothetical protein